MCSSLSNLYSLKTRSLAKTSLNRFSLTFFLMKVNLYVDNIFNFIDNATFNHRQHETQLSLKPTRQLKLNSYKVLSLKFPKRNDT